MSEIQRQRKFDTRTVYSILDLRFVMGYTRAQIRHWLIQKGILEQGEDDTQIYRIILPKGDKKARCKDIRDRYFAGFRPIF